MIRNSPSGVPLCDVLQRHDDVALKELAMWGGVSWDTASRWRSGAYGPDLNQFINLVNKGPQALRDDLLQWFAQQAGTGVQFLDVIPRDAMDLNGDKRIDTHDLVIAAAKGLGSAQQEAAGETIDASEDRVVTPEEHAALNASGCEISRWSRVYNAIVGHISPRRLA